MFIDALLTRTSSLREKRNVLFGYQMFRSYGARKFFRVVVMYKIGVGRHDWFRSPSLRTGRAILPHPALQLVVHLLKD